MVFILQVLYRTGFPDRFCLFTISHQFSIDIIHKSQQFTQRVCNILYRFIVGVIILFFIFCVIVVKRLLLLFLWKWLKTMSFFNIFVWLPNLNPCNLCGGAKVILFLFIKFSTHLCWCHLLDLKIRYIKIEYWFAPPLRWNGCRWFKQIYDKILNFNLLWHYCYISLTLIHFR